MTAHYQFNNVAFFNRQETYDGMGELMLETTPCPNNGSIMFESPGFSWLPATLCVGVSNGRKYVARFPAIMKFDETEFSSGVSTGKYIVPEDAPKNSTPYMIVQVRDKKCIQISVFIIID